MRTWFRVTPDYEIKCWDMHTIPNILWVQEAISVKKWVFAADYIRLYALYTEGGKYLDTDVLSKRLLIAFLTRNSLPQLNIIRINLQ